MTKIVVNRRYGGFSLSDEGVMLYGSLAGLDLHKTVDRWRRTNYWIGEPPEDPNSPDVDNYFAHRDLKRDDPILVQVVEALGELADGAHARLEVVSVPDDVEWEIEEYDGAEWISEVHRRW